LKEQGVVILEQTPKLCWKEHWGMHYNDTIRLLWKHGLTTKHNLWNRPA